MLVTSVVALMIDSLDSSLGTHPSMQLVSHIYTLTLHNMMCWKSLILYQTGDYFSDLSTGWTGKVFLLSLSIPLCDKNWIMILGITTKLRK